MSFTGSEPATQLRRLDVRVSLESFGKLRVMGQGGGVSIAALPLAGSTAIRLMSLPRPLLCGFSLRRGYGAVRRLAGVCGAVGLSFLAVDVCFVFLPLMGDRMTCLSVGAALLTRWSRRPPQCQLDGSLTLHLCVTRPPVAVPVSAACFGFATVRLPVGALGCVGLRPCRFRLGAAAGWCPRRRSCGSGGFRFGAVACRCPWRPVLPPAL